MRNFLFSFKTHIIGALLVGLSCASHASPQQEIANHLREGQLGQAAKLVAAERKTNPKDVDIWFLEGVVQAQSGQTDKAVATFTRITQAHPQHAESYNNLGVLAAAKGQLGEARAFFEKALRTNPSYAAVHKNLGDVNSQLAKAAYGKALMVDSKDKPATVQLSMLASTSLFAASETAPAINSSAAKPPVSTEAPVKTSAPPKTAEPIKSATVPATPEAVPSTPVIAAPAKPKAEPASASAPREPVQPVKPESDEGDRKQIEEALLAWARAWSKKDMSQYLAAYATSFDPPGKMSRKAWEEERRLRIVGKRSIQVQLSQFRIRIKGTQAQAQFVQKYDSDSFKGTSTKTLSLLKEKGHWLISSESAKPL
ncbi:tetratricopeptide repeat protein [Limnohabitans sp.]|uniref:YybH family protein n=1 Tax=Limnohabitans sp. TaxID=1907725 RepID=UPI00311E56D1